MTSKQVSSTKGSEYWAAYVGGAKIKTDGSKGQIRTDVITHKWPILSYTILSSIIWAHI